MAFPGQPSNTESGGNLTLELADLELFVALLARHCKTEVTESANEVIDGAKEG